MGKIDDFGDFVGRHFGDFAALFVLCLGVSLEVLNAIAFIKWQIQLEHVHEVATTLIGASLIAIKLRPNPKNGNGNGELK